MSIDLEAIRETDTLAQRRAALAEAKARYEATRLAYPGDCHDIRVGRSVGVDTIRRVAISLGAPQEVYDGYTNPAAAWIINRLNETAAERLDAFNDHRLAELRARPTTDDYVVMEWDEIPSGQRYVGEYGETAGQRFVFGWVEGAGTCLVPWTGPKGA